MSLFPSAKNIKTIGDPASNAYFHVLIFEYEIVEHSALEIIPIYFLLRYYLIRAQKSALTNLLQKANFQ